MEGEGALMTQNVMYGKRRQNALWLLRDNYAVRACSRCESCDRATCVLMKEITVDDILFIQTKDKNDYCKVCAGQAWE